MFKRALVVVLSAISLLTAISAPLTPATAADLPGMFVRLQVKGGAIYAFFQGDEMRMSESPRDLKDADVNTVESTTSSSKGPVRKFFEIDVPVAADDLPYGATGMRVQFSTFSDTVYATIKLEIKDEEGIKWTYVWSQNEKGGKSPKNAPVFAMANLKKMTLKVDAEGKKSTQKVSVGLKLYAGKIQMLGIKQDDENVEAELMIMNTKGFEVASEVGTLSKFGYG